jgi:phosphatidylinositol glycan class V
MLINLSQWISSNVDSSLSKKQLIRKILLVRFLYWMAMAVSCFVIPDHNPGDGVLRFDMRLLESSAQDNCFCLVGQGCDYSMATSTSSCAISRSPTLFSPSIWNFWLSPLTKWDAARFLHLAVQPSLRDPHCTTLDNDCSFATSERAHAFYPFFPMVMQQVALGLTKVLPISLLPPTFEGVMVLSGVLVNLACLLASTLALYDLTMQVCMPLAEESQRHRLAVASCLVYGIANPASVFFATTYSESLFGTCALIGHAALARRHYLVALLVWMAGSYTRSNGTIHSLWLLQHGLGHLCYNNNWTRLRTIVAALFCLLGAILVFLPVRYHDWQGFWRHCHENVSVQPWWCQQEVESSTFSLYGYTQRQHWNVGFFRYYELKQIPNFLLAAPILGLSIAGVVQWTRGSLLEYGKGKLPTTWKILLVGWPIHALSESVSLKPKKTTLGKKPCDWLLYNPILLGHYAILAILTLVGLVIAHVQISTRMICSSSPAITWFLTYCHLQDHNPRLRQFAGGYTILYMILGVILHVNFLPWT